MIEMADVLLRGLSFICAVGAGGGPIFFLLVLRPVLTATKSDGGHEQIGRRLARTSATSALLLGAASSAAFFLLAAAVAPHRTAFWDPALLTRLVAETTHGKFLLLRAAAAIGLALLLRSVAASPGSLPRWVATAALALVTLATFPLSGHAAALPTGNALVITVVGLHLLAVTAWIGGLFHVRLLLDPLAQYPETLTAAVHRFSPFALGSAGLIIVTGFLNALQYVGSLTALFGTSYGLTLAAKLLLVIPLMTFGAINYLIIRPALTYTKTAPTLPVRRLTSTVEGEVALGVVILLLVGAMTSLPYAVTDASAGADRVPVFTYFAPRWPHLSSPSPRQVWEQKRAAASQGATRSPEGIVYSEFNHQWAGAFVLVMGLLCFLHASGHPRVAWARIWPLTLIGLSIFLFLRNDPALWVIGPASLWEGMSLAHAIQHRLYIVLVACLGVVEWLGQTGRMRHTWWTYLFPGICILGSMMLFLHAHGDGSLGDADSLTHIQHVVIGTLGLLAGISRWLAMRSKGQERLYGSLWGLAVTLLGIFLVFFFREQ